MAFKVPRPDWTQIIVDKTGKATKAYSRRIDEAFTVIERQVQSQAETLSAISALQASQEQQIALLNQAFQDIQIAQQTANANASGVSGADTDNNISVSSLVTWTPGPQVSLTGVVANNLSIPGSGPQQDSDVSLFITNTSQYVMQGEYRLVEVIGGVDGATFGPWNFEVSYPEPPPATGTLTGVAVLNTDSTAVAAFSQARATTGAIEYRLDFRKISGPSVSNLRAYLFARRA